MSIVSKQKTRLSCADLFARTRKQGKYKSYESTSTWRTRDVSMQLFLPISLPLSLSSTLPSFALAAQFCNKATRLLTKRSLGKRCFAANFRALRINFPPRILVRMEREDPAGRRFPEKRALLTRRRTTASRGTTEQWITTDTKANLRETFPFPLTCAPRCCSLSC